LSTIIAVTGFNPVTFNVMRRRNGLLGEREEKGRWARYSIADICAAQAARELINKGISTQLAVDMANKLLSRFECLDDEDRLKFYDRHIAVFTRTGSSRAAISLDFFHPTEAPLSRSTIAVLDLYDIQMRVLDALLEVETERVVGPEVIFEALAKALEKNNVAADAKDDMSSGSGGSTGGADHARGNTERSIRGTLAELPPRLRKSKLRRGEASEYLEIVHGIRYAPATLAKMVTTGGGPRYHTINRSVLYPVDELDAWARKQLSPLHSSSDSVNGAGD
jgi:hypothetical protein